MATRAGAEGVGLVGVEGGVVLVDEANEKGEGSRIRGREGDCARWCGNRCFGREYGACSDFSDLVTEESGVKIQESAVYVVG